MGLVSGLYIYYINDGLLLHTAIRKLCLFLPLILTNLAARLELRDLKFKPPLTWKKTKSLKSCNKLIDEKVNWWESWNQTDRQTDLQCYLLIHYCDWKVINKRVKINIWIIKWVSRIYHCFYSFRKSITNIFLKTWNFHPLSKHF